jgi:hypothetical protein
MFSGARGGKSTRPRPARANGGLGDEPDLGRGHAPRSPAKAGRRAAEPPAPRASDAARAMPTEAPRTDQSATGAPPRRPARDGRRRQRNGRLRHGAAASPAPGCVLRRTPERDARAVLPSRRTEFSLLSAARLAACARKHGNPPCLCGLSARHPPERRQEEGTVSGRHGRNKKHSQVKIVPRNRLG